MAMQWSMFSLPWFEDDVEDVDDDCDELACSRNVEDCEPPVLPSSVEWLVGCFTDEGSGGAVEEFRTSEDTAICGIIRCAHTVYYKIMCRFCRLFTSDMNAARGRG